MIELLTFLLVIITSVYAYLTFRILQSNRESVAIMNSQIESATRPYVVVSLVRQRSGFYSFRVSNLGHSAAKQVKLTCDPEIKPVRAGGSVTQFGNIPDAIGLFQHPISYMAPSETVEALVGHYSGIKASYPDLSFKVTLQYEGSGRSYAEAVELSLKPTEDAQYLMDYDVGKELHEIREVLDRIRAKLEA